MRVGFYFSGNLPTIGGNFSYEDSIVSNLPHIRNEGFDYYIFYYGEKSDQCIEGVEFVNLSRQIALPDPPPDLSEERKAFSLWSVLRRILWPIRMVRNWIRSLGEKPIQENNDIPEPEPFPREFFGLQEALDYFRIDFVWFIGHSFEPIRIPYATTVLDLAHSVHPLFPEVSISGNTWEMREEHFQTVLPKASYIVTGTNAGKDEIERFYGVNPNRIRILPLFYPSYLNLENAVVDLEVRFSIKGPFLFYPAQFWPHKNHFTALQVLNELHAGGETNFSLVFTGSDKGNLSYIQSEVERLSLQKHVHFLGFVTNEELITLYKNAYCLLYLTIFGPDNLPPLEAFKLGCPVIASAVSGAEEQLGDAAILVDPFDTKKIVQKIRELGASDHLRRSLVEKGRGIFADRTVQNYIELMHAILAEFKMFRNLWSYESKYEHS